LIYFSNTQLGQLLTLRTFWFESVLDAFLTVPGR
jgi:hypothetical protein